MTASILWLGQNDWGSICNRTARALNQHYGATVARVWTLVPHPFGYQEDVAGPEPTDDLRAFASEVDWVFHAGDGDYWYTDRMADRLGVSSLARRGVTHSGSAYRATPDLYNLADQRRGIEARFIGLDSLRFAQGDATVRPLISPAPGRIGPRRASLGGPGRLRVAHAPSNRATKGTAAIVEALQGRETIEMVLIEGRPHAECEALLGACDVLVDQMNPEVGGLGALAVEALAMGLVVVSDCRHVSAEAWARLPFGERPVVQVSEPRDLPAALDRLRDRVEYERQQALGLEWARRNASPEGIAAIWALEAGRRSGLVPPPPAPKISAPMIVKDEERGIEKALESLVGVVDEVVVVDTGSTDKTVAIVEVIREMWRERQFLVRPADDGAPQPPVAFPEIRLLHHPWQDDFSEARNFAQDACAGDWCVILDGDEVLEPGDLRASIHAAPDHAIDAVTTLLASSGGTTRQIRAHRRTTCRWTHSIHNQITGWSRMAPSTARVRQSYNKGLEHRTARLPLLLEHVRAHPLDPHGPYYLARTYWLAEDWPKVLEWSQETEAVGSRDAGFASFWALYGVAEFMVNGIERALAILERGLALHPDCPDIWRVKANLCCIRWLQTIDVPAYRMQICVPDPASVTEAWRLMGFELLADGAT